MIGALLRRFDVIEITGEPKWMSAGPAAAVGVAVSRSQSDCVAARARTRIAGFDSQPKTFTALAITSAMVVTATRLCTAIIPFAQRASGMVSVGENAIALVRLT